MLSLEPKISRPGAILHDLVLRRGRQTQYFRVTMLQGHSALKPKRLYVWHLGLRVYVGL